jgi:hypothetical protein
VLQEIRTLRLRGAIVANVHGLVFTRDDGRAITKDMIQFQVEKAVALTAWARRASMLISP